MRKQLFAIVLLMSATVFSVDGMPPPFLRYALLFGRAQARTKGIGERLLDKFGPDGLFRVGVTAAVIGVCAAVPWMQEKAQELFGKKESCDDLLNCKQCKEK